jgi:hypothetical protein
MTFKRMILPFLMVLKSFYCFAEDSLSSSKLNCISQKMIELNRSDKALYPSVNLMIAANGKQLTFLYGPDVSLTYNVATKTFAWNLENGSSNKVYKNSKGYYYLDKQDETLISNTHSRKTDQYLLPSEVKRVIDDLLGMNPARVSRKINECQKIKTFREQLSLPLTPLEIRTCRNKLDSIKKLQFCSEKKKCGQVYSELASQPADPYSFVSLFESEINMSDPQKRIGVVMAADTVGSMGANALLVANRKSIALVARRVGLRFTGVFAFFNILS